MDQPGTITKTVPITNFAGITTSVNISVAEAEEEGNTGRILMTRHDGIQLLGSPWERLLELPSRQLRFLKLDALPDEPGASEYLNRFDLPWTCMDFTISLAHDDPEETLLPNIAAEASWWLNDIVFRLGMDFIRQFAEDPAYDVYLETEITDRCQKYGIPALPVNIPPLHIPWRPAKVGSQFPPLSTQLVRTRTPVAVIGYMGGHALSYCLKVAMQHRSMYQPIEEENEGFIFPGSDAHGAAGLTGVQFEDEDGNSHPWPKETPSGRPRRITFAVRVWRQDGMETISVDGDFAATVLRDEELGDQYLAIATEDADPESVEHITNALGRMGAPVGRARQIANVAVHGSENALDIAFRDNIRAIDALASAHGGLDHLSVTEGIATVTVGGVAHIFPVQEEPTA